LVQLLSISNELPFVSFGARAAFLKTLATHKHGAEMIFENKPILNFLNYSVIAGGVGHHDLRDRDLASTFALLSKHDQIIPTLSSDNFRKSIEILKRSPDSVAPSVIKNVEQRISDPKKIHPLNCQPENQLVSNPISWSLEFLLDCMLRSTNLDFKD